MKRAEILDAAREAVTVDRAATHGDAEDNFGLIAAYWSAHLDVNVTATDVAVMMSMLKLARIKQNPAHADHWVDIAGYSACGGEIATNAEVKARAKPLRSPARAIQRAKFKPGPAWTPDEDERAIEMTAQGFTIAEVAAELGRPEHGTRKRLLKFSDEVKTRAQAKLDERGSFTVIVEPPCQGFTPEMDERLRKYMADGIGIGGAASLLKIARNRVQARWDELKVAE